MAIGGSRFDLDAPEGGIYLKVKNWLKHTLGRYPSLFFPAYRLTAPRHHIQECLFSPEKEIVIEGFPRSANTFAVVAFCKAQGRHVPMGHHLHVEAQILMAASLGKPCLALIRNPDDAVRSLKIRHPDVKVERAYKRWLDFYSAVEKVLAGVVVADFTEVTTDYGQVIERLNRFFGTSYMAFEYTESNVHEVFEEIDAINRQIDGGKETHVARPSDARQKMAVELPEYPIRDEARELYEAILERR